MIPTTGLGAGASFSSAGFSSVDSVAGVGCCAVSTPGIAITQRLREYCVFFNSAKASDPFLETNITLVNLLCPTC